MKTQKQLFQRFELINQTGDVGDPLWAMRFILFRFLPFNLVKGMLRPGVDMPYWFATGLPLPLDPTYVDSYIKRISKSGFNIAMKHRTLEAKRNIMRMVVLLWIKEDPLQEFADRRLNYANYGCPILRKVGEKYLYEMPKVKKLELIAEGKKCDPACPTCGNPKYQ